MEQRYDIYGDDYSNEIFFLYFDFEKEIRRIAALNDKVPSWIAPMIENDMEEIYRTRREVDEKEGYMVDLWMEDYRLARFESIPKDKIDKIRLINHLNEEEAKIELANQDFLIKFLDRMGLVYIKTHFDIFIEKVLRETFKKEPRILKSSNKQLNYSDFVDSENLEQVTEIIISKEIKGILNNGSAGIYNFFKTIKIDIKKDEKLWKNFEASYDIRNNIIHNPINVDDNEECLYRLNYFDKMAFNIMAQLIKKYGKKDNKDNSK